ncbi:sulfatase-like hydrolase/transferase [Clostridium sp. MCC353]|uniref:sulfatase family protein n=1 Tax=Clostridium sp. MCC353 TaxID=2592646 RepID=UPI001C0387A7|nr:sulfatase [Clostridium sp. MCC353]MBT9778660.1 sulfatase-like hydrolase/transferase [Clostridium sp. MCC353]
MKVIYFDIDTLRPDHLGCYKSQLNTPNMDSLAQDGVRFTQAFASNTPCMPSRAALFTGRFGVCNGVETHGERALQVHTPKEDALCFRLCQNGVETVGISSFGRHPALWYYQGFCQVIDPSFRSGGGHFQRFDGSEVNRAARQVLTAFKGENLFLHLHYWDPHGPLAPPEEILAQTPVPSTKQIPDRELDALCASREYRGGEHVGVKNRQDLEELLRRYDAEILYTDKLIGEMTEFLKSEGIYDECVLILSADHGEQYGEAQMLLEHGTVHDSCIHIPMILKFPRQQHGGQVSDSMVYGLDIAPTVTSFFGIEPAESWDGVPLQNSVTPDGGRDFLVCDHGLYTCQRAVFDREWKMVHTFNSGPWDFPDYALFDRKNDPAELNNLAAQRPEILRSFQKKEADWLEETLHGEPDILEELGKANAQHGWVAVNRYHSSRGA